MIADAAPGAPPRIHYPPDLPVSQRRDDILEALCDNQAMV